MPLRTVIPNRLRFRRKRNVLFGLLMILLGLTLVALIAEEESLTQRNIRFEHAGNELAGTLVLPGKDAVPEACIVFVHGSGDMPRDAYGYYMPLWHLFAEKGWCSLSWDKPGVGQSSGDWRNQSMADRASEVSAAIDFLRSEGGLGSGHLAMIGFSQAGWVMPKVANRRDDIAFIITVSGAINWIAQSRYSGSKRRLAKGMSLSETQADEQHAAMIEQLLQKNALYSEYLELVKQAGRHDQMSEEIWGFALRNWKTDVRWDLHQLRVPVLALYGSHDAYVDSALSAAAYKNILTCSRVPFFRVQIIEGADHGLMRTDEIKPKHEGVAAWLLLLKIWILGDDLFAKEFLDELGFWLNRFDYSTGSFAENGANKKKCQY